MTRTRPGRRRMDPKKGLVALALSLMVLLAPAGARAGEGGGGSTPEAFAVLYDLAIVRPLAIVSLAAGVVLFVPSAALTTLTGNDVKPLVDALVHKPYQFAIKRPIGNFGELSGD